MRKNVLQMATPLEGADKLGILAGSSSTVFTASIVYDYTSYFDIRNLASMVAQVGLSPLLRFSRDEALILTSIIAQCYVPI